MHSWTNNNNNVSNDNNNTVNKPQFNALFCPKTFLPTNKKYCVLNKINLLFHDWQIHKNTYIYKF